MEHFGELFTMRDPSPAPLSYGHLVCLGAPITYPAEGEPNIKSFADSIDEAIALTEARGQADFSAHPFYRQYLDAWRYLKGQFPDVDMPFSGPGAQGPITTAVLMRGQDFLLDIYDEPEKCLRFLSLLTESIISFRKLTQRVNGLPERFEFCGIADDFASLIPPDMWPEFVLPFIGREFNALATDVRELHVESLVPKHLPHLSKLNLTHFQPSVSTALTLKNVAANLDPGIPFDWLLYAYHITDMTDEAIEAWVDQAVEAGVSIIRTQLGAYACMRNAFDRFKAFFAAFDKYRQ